MTDKVIEDLLTRQKRCVELLKNFQVNTSKQKAAAAMTLQDYQSRSDVLESYWLDFRERDYQLSSSADFLKERSYFKFDYYDAALSDYLSNKSWIKDRIAALTPMPIAASSRGDSSVSNPTQSSQASFERVKLPKFDGCQRDWQSFKSKFQSLVLHDALMPIIIKFEHLANALVGEAAEKLKSFDLVEENFITAWEALCKRYDSPLLRFSTHFNALIRLPAAHKESSEHLSSLLHTALESKNVFTSLKLPVAHWDMVFIQLLENKLPSSTRLEWTRLVKKAGTGFPKFSEFQQFLEDRIQSLDIVDDLDVVDNVDKGDSELRSVKSKSQSSKKSNTSDGKNVTAHMVTGSSKNSNNSKLTDTCSFCQGTHFINACQKFTALTPAKRKEHAVAAKLCFNCLSARHALEACTSKGTCYVCRGKHHSKLHLEDPSSKTTGSQSSASTVASSVVHFSASNLTTRVAQAGCSQQLLATAIVVLESEEGVRVTARALLDSCAERSFVAENIAQILSAKRTSVNVAVSGLNGTTNAVARSEIKLRLKSLTDSKFSHEFSALVVQRVSTLLPRDRVTSGNWNHTQGLQLADPHFGRPGKVDCILSSAVYGAVMLPEIRRGHPSHAGPVALLSIFGWVLVGNTSADGIVDKAAVHHISVDHQLSEAIARFWESEEVPRKPAMTSAEQECWEHFKSTHRRNESGRFVLRLPFRKEPSFIGSDRIARSCMTRLERRFAKQPEVKAAYHRFMREYSDLGHMEPVSSDDLDAKEGFFLPHHPVFKQDGSKKIRVVFNGSQKDEAGNSLNESLHAGPKLQEDIVTVIIRWCFFEFVFVCDIVKNFRQMLLDVSDTRWQRIFWRFDTSQPLQVWRLLTATYGTVSAPFLANACLLELAHLVAHSHQLASVLLCKHRYVDDFLAGGDTLEEATQAQQELIEVLSLVGMSVDKCAANHSQLVASNLADGPKELKEKDVVSTLGMKWDPTGDVFHFQVKLPATPPATSKRSILSEVSKLFDPIGFLSPVIIRAKLLIQYLWLQGADWDAPVSSRLEGDWLSYRQQLVDLESIRIPRWNGTGKDSVWHLHGFCDASERAFAAALFVVVPGSGRVPRLLVAKSKVAPLKVVSLPKLELCGAALLANLASRILSQLNSKPEEIHCWSDSKVVLAWLQSPPSRWKTYVANRVSEVTTLIPSATWCHVSSADNSADLATRGCSPLQLKESKLWWSGPDWLQQDKSKWPTDLSECSTDLEMRRQTELWLVQENYDWSTWFGSFSSFDRLVGTLAFCLRWRNLILVPKEHRRRGRLTAEEFSAATIFLFRLVQSIEYASELQTLSARQELPLSHSLKRLTPFVGVDGLLRVGGRLHNSFLSESEKHPVILPKRHHIVVLLIRKAHVCTLHGGATAVQSYLSRGYWIVQARNVIRRVVRECVTCTRFNARTQEQLMGALSAVRTSPARPFLHTGVDFAGHFWIKASAGRGQKSFKDYVAVFVCLAVKAVHLELVSDLTTQAFLAAFRRFVARRGLCKVIYSDNGRTFLGSEAEIHRLFAESSASGQLVSSLLAKDGVEWKFIPPRAPNFGGLWETNVKSFKRHLYRVIGETKLSFEQFSTLLASIEACLNSRPLCALSSDASDVCAISPGHFLIGGPLVSLPEPFSEFNQAQNLSANWKSMQLMRNHFWQRWRKEYLSQLQQRTKWLKPNHQLQVGDLVLFKDNLVPPSKWPLARITALHPGKDQLTRVVTIRTATSEFQRPINKLILLPVHEDTSARLLRVAACMVGGDVQEIQEAQEVGEE